MTAREINHLDRLEAQRNRLRRQPDSRERSAELADVYAMEAHCWPRLFEHASKRVVWRAAVYTEAYAQSLCRRWNSWAARKPDKHLEPGEASRPPKVQASSGGRA